MKKNVTLSILKCLSMLIVLNSHADVLYPKEISFLASGGAIGNELFFLISGYLFTMKSDIWIDIRKRFWRLYLPTYIMIAITSAFGDLQIDSISKIIKVFIWPTQFWFVGAVLIYALLMYWLLSRGSNSQKKCMIFLTLIAIVDILVYIFFIKDKSTWVVENVYFGFIPYRVIYSFFAYFIGFYLRKNEKYIYKINKSVSIILAILFIMVFYGFKLLLNKSIVPMSLQILSQPITILSALFIFVCFMKLDLNSKLEGKKLGNCINWISSLSLEFYLVQFILIQKISLVNIIFPINLLICSVTVLIAAWLLNKICIIINNNIAL